MHDTPRLAALAAALLFPAAAPGAAQSCGPGETTWKNDNLTGTPAVIQGICEGDAMGAVYPLPAGPLRRLETVNLFYGALAQVNGHFAVVNVQVHDGVSWAGNVPTLGPKVLDLAVATGTNATVFSHGWNAIDLSALGVTVGHATDDFVVVAEMVFNVTTGSCVTGWPADFTTDATSIFTCTSLLNRNLIRLTTVGEGWQDAKVATALGFPLCPIYYNGNWALRACSTDGAGAWTVLAGAKAGSNGLPELRASGTLAPGAKDALYLGRARPSAPATLVFGVSQLNAAFKGGLLVPAPLLLLALATNAQGGLDLPFALDASVPPGTPLVFQFWISDPAATFGLSASNGLLGVVP
jgi:hypothetical protein